MLGSKGDSRQMDGVLRPQNCWLARSVGDRGGPMPCCICGWPRKMSPKLHYERKLIMHLRLERWASPVSSLLLVIDGEEVLRALEFGGHEARMHRLLREHYGDYTLEEGAAPISLTRALQAYFDGRIDALEDIQIATGGTPFQREVWNELRAIPAGTTISYGQLASRLGRTGASRAAGAANGA